MGFPGGGTDMDSLQLERTTDKRMTRDNPGVGNGTATESNFKRDYREVLKYPVNGKEVPGKIRNDFKIGKIKCKTGLKGDSNQGSVKSIDKRGVKSGQKRKVIDTDLDTAQLRIDQDDRGLVKLRRTSSAELSEIAENMSTMIKPTKSKLSKSTAKSNLEHWSKIRQETALKTGAVPKIPAKISLTPDRSLKSTDKKGKRISNARPNIKHTFIEKSNIAELSKADILSDQANDMSCEIKLGPTLQLKPVRVIADEDRVKLSSGLGKIKLKNEKTENSFEAVGIDRDKLSSCELTTAVNSSETVLNQDTQDNIPPIGKTKPTQKVRLSVKDMIYRFDLAKSSIKKHKPP